MRKRSRIVLSVNGADHSIEAERSTPLLFILRNDCGLNGPKYGCGYGECGACTVIIDGLAARSCVIPVSMAEGRRILTLEGLADGDRLSPVQQCFVEAQAAQCGYCLNGMIITAKALLDHNPDPSESEVRYGLAGNLCRCTGYDKIVRAVQAAAAELRETA